MAESRPLRHCFEVPFGAAVLKITVGIVGVPSRYRRRRVIARIKRVLQKTNLGGTAEFSASSLILGAKPIYFSEVRV